MPAITAELELLMVDMPLAHLYLTKGILSNEVHSARSALVDRPLSYLADVERRILDVALVAVKKTVATNDSGVAGTLLQYVRDVGADLIVMTTHGYGPLKRFWSGSVTDAVMRQSDVRVLVMRPRDDREANFSELPVFRNVLVPLDGSTAAQTAIDQAIAVAHQNASFTLLRALTPVPLAVLTPEFATTAPPVIDMQLTRSLEMQARASLEVVRAARAPVLVYRPA